MTEEEKDLLDYFKKTPPISRKLSNRERDIFLKILDEPPEANEALKNAAKKYNEKKLTDFMLDSPLKNSGIDLSRSKAFDSREPIKFEDE